MNCDRRLSESFAKFKHLQDELAPETLRDKLRLWVVSVEALADLLTVLSPLCV